MLQGEPRAIEPAGDLFGGDSKAAVGVFTAQGFHFMGCKINDQQAAIGIKNAACLDQGAGGFIEVVQDLMDDSNRHQWPIPNVLGILREE